MKFKLGFLNEEKILKISNGEVLIPETFTIRDGKPYPIRDGIMCQKIFGPIKDYVCECGKIWSKNNLESRCTLCGVEINKSSIRSSRFGHIDIGVSILHPLAIKWVSYILKISENVVNDILICKKSIKIENNNVIIEDEYPSSINNGTCVGLLKVLKEFKPDEKTPEKKLYLLNKIDDFFVNKILVSPPNFRPILHINGTNISDAKNELYLSLLRRKIRLDNIKKYNPHQLILMNEIIQIQRAVNSLFIDGISKNGIKYKSILDNLKGKKGLFRNNLLGKRVNFSGRSIITPGPDLKIDEIGIPIKMAYELLHPFLINKLKHKVGNLKLAIKLCKNKDDLAIETLYEISKNYVMMANRQPSLHKFNIRSFKIKIHTDSTIKLSPLVCSGYNADHDGDSMAIHLPISRQAIKECKTLLNPVNNVINESNGSPVIYPTHEILMGLHNITNIKRSDKERKFKSLEIPTYLCQINEININDEIILYKNNKYEKTCLGREIISEILKVPINEPLTKYNIKKYIKDSYKKHNRNDFADSLLKLVKLGFENSTKNAVSLCINDFKTPENKEKLFNETYSYLNENNVKKDEAIQYWMEVIKTLQNDFLENNSKNPLSLMLKVGARASMEQVSQIVISKGMLANSSGKISKNPIKNNYTEGLSPIDYFNSTYGSRKGLADVKLGTPQSGYLARKLVTVSRDLYIRTKKCNCSSGIWVNKNDIYNRQILCKENDKYLVRSPIFCDNKLGICSSSYGVDPSTGKNVKIDKAVGVIAAQVLSEPTTQMILRSFHISGAASLKESKKIVKSSKSGKVKIIKNCNFNIVKIENEKYLINKTARLLVKNGDEIKNGDKIAKYLNVNVGNEDVINKLPILEIYYEMRKPKVESVIATQFGKIKLETEDDKVKFILNGNEIGETYDQPIYVHDNQYVNKGDFLSYGEANLKSLYKKTDDLELVATVFVNRLSELYAEEGININKIHLEMIFRGLTIIVKKENGTNGIRPYDNGDILLMGLTGTSKNFPSWIKAVGFGWAKENISRAAAFDSISYDLPSERIMTGELLQKRNNSHRILANDRKII